MNAQPKSSVIIACDIGLKRIGLATLIKGIVLPLEPIIRKNRNQAARDLREVLQMREANKLIVGLPLYQHTQDMSSQKPQEESQQESQIHHIDSSTNPTANRIKHFIGLLDCASLLCEVVYVNEDFSSIIALENLSHTTKSARKKSVKDGRLDSLAACEILRRYLKISDANP